MSIYAWRYWFYRGGALYGSYNEPWTIGQPMHARHAYPFGKYSVEDTINIAHRNDGASPSISCTCGIYALKNADNEYCGRNKYAPWHTKVIGVVEIWGKIITAENGYRAEYARIRALVDTSMDVATVYGVPNLPSIEYARQEYFS